jgi:hypothetical protein
LIGNSFPVTLRVFDKSRLEGWRIFATLKKGVRAALSNIVHTKKGIPDAARRTFDANSPSRDNKNGSPRDSKPLRRIFIFRAHRLGAGSNLLNHPGQRSIALRCRIRVCRHRRKSVSANLREAVGGKIKPMFEAEARENMARGGQGFANLRNLHSSKRAAETANVSPRSVDSASKVLERGTSELLDAVMGGEVSVSAAAQIAELPREERRARTLL